MRLRELINLLGCEAVWGEALLDGLDDPVDLLGVVRGEEHERQVGRGPQLVEHRADDLGGGLDGAGVLGDGGGEGHGRAQAVTGGSNV